MNALEFVCHRTHNALKQSPEHKAETLPMEPAMIKFSGLNVGLIINSGTEVKTAPYPKYCDYGDKDEIVLFRMSHWFCDSLIVTCRQYK
jgi:hypothetical protein